jgi:hypothetical protein
MHLKDVGEKFKLAVNIVALLCDCPTNARLLNFFVNNVLSICCDSSLEFRNGNEIVVYTQRTRMNANLPVDLTKGCFTQSIKLTYLLFDPPRVLQGFEV